MPTTLLPPPSARRPGPIAPSPHAQLPMMIPGHATGGNQVGLLVDEHTAMPELRDAISGARAVIDVAMFSWMPTGSGHEIAELLKSRARAGVEVNVEIDDFGSIQLPHSARARFFDEMARAGVNVLHNSDLKLGHREAVDHRKLFVIDGSTAFIGGMNLGSSYDAWHDTMLKLQGPVAAQAGAEFVSGWTAHGGAVSPRQRASIEHPPQAAGAMTATVVSNAPGVSMDLTDFYLEKIGSASTRLWLQSPVISTQRFADALMAAARRGVDVELAVSGQGAVHAPPGMFLISRSFYPELVAAGVKVFEQQQMSHSKMLIADDTLAVGSMNLSNRSAAHDFEASGVVDDAGIADQAAAMFASDVTRARAITPADLDSRLDRALAQLRRRGVEY